MADDDFKKKSHLWAENNDCLLSGVHVPYINCMPGGVIVGDSDMSVAVCLLYVLRQLSDRALLIPFVDVLAEDSHLWLKIQRFTFMAEDPTIHIYG